MDRDRRVLLVHFHLEDPQLPTGLWACPGGGVNPGETHAEALQRELREEIGLVLEASEIGEPIWFKEHQFPMVGWDGQADTFYVVEVDSFEPAPHFSPAKLRAEHLDQVRWWTGPELQEGQRRQDSGDRTHPDFVTLSPRSLCHLFEDLLAQGRPREPLWLDPLGRRIN